MAKIARIHALGGPNDLFVDEIDVAKPSTGEVRIEVGGIGLNRAETMLMRGLYGEIPVPALFGYEAAGRIEGVGEGVTQYSVGDRVAILPGLPMNYGACGELILAPAELLVRTPARLSDVEAAASWMQYLTAYAVRAYKPIQPGDAVLITAASSSVGIAAIQLVKADGGIPIAVTRGPSKVDALKQHGAAHVIVSDEEDVAARVQEITGGKGVATAFDAVAGPSFASVLGSLGLGGLAIVYGGLGGEPSQFSAVGMAFGDHTIRGFATNYLVADNDLCGKAIAHITEGLENGTLKPVIDKTFALADISDAYTYLESNQQVGKIVVTP